MTANSGGPARAALDLLRTHKRPLPSTKTARDRAVDQLQGRAESRALVYEFLADVTDFKSDVATFLVGFYIDDDLNGKFDFFHSLTGEFYEFDLQELLFTVIEGDLLTIHNKHSEWDVFLFHGFEVQRLVARALIVIKKHYELSIVAAPKATNTEPEGWTPF